MSPILQVENLSKRFGGLQALVDVSFQVEEGQIVGLIGPNGAGKSTLFGCLTGFLPPSGGTVIFDGKNITNFPPHQICQLGIARTFQIVQILPAMTVLKNVVVGSLLHHTTMGKALAWAKEVLALTELDKVAQQMAEDLTMPEKMRLQIAMALATEPRLLMLDEAMAGLTPTEVKQAVGFLQRVRDSGVTLIVVEHVMEAIMPIADRVIVLNSGRKIAEGPPEQIVNDKAVISAYLGDRYAEGI
ncbi:MAG: ABC transporter ATP-binding protein [Limnochordia bacterium]|jgi:branched-chain amino acid transport system ATP-binding protein